MFRPHDTNETFHTFYKKNYLFLFLIHFFSHFLLRFFSFICASLLYTFHKAKIVSIWERQCYCLWFCEERDPPMQVCKFWAFCNEIKPLDKGSVPHFMACDNDMIWGTERGRLDNTRQRKEPQSLWGLYAWGPSFSALSRTQFWHYCP